MDLSISDLENKINELVAVVDKLRTENEALRKQLKLKEQENKRLVEKVELAKSQLKKIVEQLPEN